MRHCFILSPFLPGEDFQDRRIRVPTFRSIFGDVLEQPDDEAALLVLVACRLGLPTDLRQGHRGVAAAAAIHAGRQGPSKAAQAGWWSPRYHCVWRDCVDSGGRSIGERRPPMVCYQIGRSTLNCPKNYWSSNPRPQC